MSYDDILIVKLRRINLFLALFYVPAWLSSSIGSYAAINDFLFLENMSQYEKFDSAVAQAASKKLAKHKMVSGRRNCRLCLVQWSPCNY